MADLQPTVALQSSLLVQCVSTAEQASDGALAGPGLKVVGKSVTPQESDGETTTATRFHLLCQPHATQPTPISS